MRVGVVSDIHGNLPALRAVVDVFTGEGVDAVINLGDSVSGPLLPRETADFLMGSGWTHLAGNHERQVLTEDPGRMGASDAYAHGRLEARHFAWMRGLRDTGRFEDVFLCHGSPESDLDYLLETVDERGIRAATEAEVEERLGGVEAPAVLCGHSHLPRLLRLRSGRLLVNPGSVGLQAFRVDRPLPHAVATHSTPARCAILERRGGRWEGRLLEVPYDVAPMAELARLRGRGSWVEALTTGRC